MIIISVVNQHILVEHVYIIMVLIMVMMIPEPIAVSPIIKVVNIS